MKSGSAAASCISEESDGELHNPTWHACWGKVLYERLHEWKLIQWYGANVDRKRGMTVQTINLCISNETFK